MSTRSLNELKLHSKINMHEFSLAENVLEMALKILKDQGGTIITGIELEVGKASGVDLESFRFALDIVLENSLHDPINIKITEKLAIGYCSNCKSEYPLTRVYDLCPNCGSFCSAVVGGKELKVKAIVVK